MATILQFLKFQFLRLVITFFVSLAPVIVMVPGDCCFYVYCVNVHFHRKKYIEYKTTTYIKDRFLLSLLIISESERNN